jgi:hypothetical protein
VCSTAGRLRENRLHSVIGCLAVCTALSGQLQVGEDVFFILWRQLRGVLCVYLQWLVVLFWSPHLLHKRGISAFVVGFILLPWLYRRVRLEKLCM